MPASASHVRHSRAGPRPARTLAVALLGACGVSLSCASAPDQAEAPRWAGAEATPGAEQPAPIRTLRRRAAEERASPVERAMRAPAPPGFDERSLPAAPTDLARATLALADALKQVEAPVGDAPGDEMAGEGRANPGGLRRYVAGRSRMLSGDLSGAIADFLAAARADPGAPEPWRALGEAREASGNEAGALAAFREALARDPNDPVSRVRVGRAAVRARDFAAGARALAGLWGSATAALDPALPYLIAQDLARALRELGYLSAAAEAFEFALEAPEPLPARTALWDDLTALYRDRGQTLRDVGDIHAALGRFDHAGDAYARAAAYPSIDDAAALTPRRVYACMRAGEPAGAALAALEDLSRDLTPADARAPLLRYLAAHAGLGDSLLRALNATIESRPPGARPLSEGAAARARAACMSPGDAAKALRKRLADAPDDPDALADLLGRLPPPPATDAIREIIRLSAASEWRTPEYARTLLLVAADAPALLECWPALPKPEERAPAARLVRAMLLREIDPAAAEPLLAELAGPDPAFASPAAVARAETLMILARFEEAHAAARALRPATSDARLRVGALLGEIGLPEEGLATISTLMDRETASVEALLLGAALHRQIGGLAEAEALTHRALAHAPYSEAAHAMLLSLLTEFGRTASERALGDAIRALRQASPSGPTIRMLLAREHIAAGRPDRAESDLLALLGEDPGNGEAVRLLTIARLSRDGAAEHAAWLESRLPRYAHVPAYTIELARSYAAADEADRAVATLDAWLERRPGDALAGRALEDTLRGVAARPALADAHAVERLNRVPRTADSSLELAEVHTAARRWDAAAEAALRIDPAKPLTPAQVARGERLAEIASAGVPGVPGGAPAAPADDNAGAGSLALLDALAERLPALPPRAHLARLAMMGRAARTPEQTLIAIDLALAQSAPLGEQPALTALEGFRAAGRAPEALVLARTIAERARPATPGVTAAWIALAVMHADTENAVAAVRASAADRTAPEVMEALMSIRGGETDEPPGAAGLAYVVGAFFATADRDEDAERLWRLALEFDPRHPMANNNIGYRMVEEGERLAEAHAMIAVAHAEAPTEAAITDSLGWARYRLGIIENRVGADGRSLMEGAVTLLRKAAAMQATGSAEPEILDHLGDALWAAGQKDDAVRHWERAAQIVARYVEVLGARAQADPAIREGLDRLRALGDRSKAKVDAAAGAADPPVTPIVGGGDAIPNEAPAPPAGAEARPAT